MKTKDARKLKPGEIEKKLAELNTELIILQGQSATGTPPKSPGQIKQIKKLMAKLKTLQREQEIAGMFAPKEEKTEEVKVNARN